MVGRLTTAQYDMQVKHKEVSVGNHRNHVFGSCGGLCSWFAQHAPFGALAASSAGRHRRSPTDGVGLCPTRRLSPTDAGLSAAALRNSLTQQVQRPRNRRLSAAPACCTGVAPLCWQHPGARGRANRAAARMDRGHTAWCTCTKPCECTNRAYVACRAPLVSAWCGAGKRADMACLAPLVDASGLSCASHVGLAWAQASGRNSYNDFVIFGGPVSVKFPGPPAPVASNTNIVVSGAPGRFDGQPIGSMLQPGPGIG